MKGEHKHIIILDKPNASKIKSHIVEESSKSQQTAIRLVSSTVIARLFWDPGIPSKNGYSICVKCICAVNDFSAVFSPTQC